MVIGRYVAAEGAGEGYNAIVPLALYFWYPPATLHVSQSPKAVDASTLLLLLLLPPLLPHHQH